MSRLIDADDLIEYIKIWDIGNSISSDQKEFINCINRQLTVFDVDKVIEALEQEKTELKRLLSENVGTGYEFASKCRLDTLIKAIEIVKEGGVK